jgi:hypothetical protein
MKLKFEEAIAVPDSQRHSVADSIDYHSIGIIYFIFSFFFELFLLISFLHLNRSLWFLIVSFFFFEKSKYIIKRRGTQPIVHRTYTRESLGGRRETRKEIRGN